MAERLDESQERPPPVGSDLLWTPLLASLVVLAPGVAALLTGRIALFPSLGPSALTQVHEPDRPSARFYNVVVSHLVGLGAAFGAVYALGIADEPSVFEVGEVSAARVAASVIAIGVAALLELILKAVHAPAASTTLLASLGSFHPTVGDTATVVLGVFTVGILGELLRRARLRWGV